MRSDFIEVYKIMRCKSKVNAHIFFSKVRFLKLKNMLKVMAGRRVKTVLFSPRENTALARGSKIISL